MENKLKVAVLGGGVIGVTSALRIIENVKNVQVTLMSHEFSPHTTGDGSAGLWLPYALGAGVSDERLSNWCSDSLKYFVKIANSPDATQYGVSFLPIHYIAENKKDLYPNYITDELLGIPNNNFWETNHEDLPVHLDKILGSREMTSDELEIYPSKYRFGRSGLTVFIECKKLLPKLIERFHALGGKVVRRKLHKLHELIGEYDVVANCAGLNSAFLVPDPAVYPIRGQVVKVNAPWIKHCVMAKEFYIIPNTDVVTLGGTIQENDWNVSVDNDDKDRILKGTSNIFPSLMKAKHIEDWVGLRPGRDCPRVERDLLCRNSTVLHVIHNYGHGGSGVTLSWGCAGDVVHFLKDIMKETRVASRL